MAKATQNRTGTNRIAGKNGKAPTEKLIEIPPLMQNEITLTLIGDRPLLVNNKMSVAEAIADRYTGPGGKVASIDTTKLTNDEAYVKAFYVMPSSKYEPPDKRAKYGIPTSGIKKCACKAIRHTGITDNTTIGVIGKAFFILSDAGGLNAITFKTLERDIRMTNIGSGQKTVPKMTHRPMFHEWRVSLRIRFNEKLLNEKTIINLFMHAGAYIGLCEMRAEKNQGECGGFYVKSGT